MEQNKNILVTIPLEARHRKALEAAAPGCRFRMCNGGYVPKDLPFSQLEPCEELTREAVDWAHIILGNVDSEFLRSRESLCWLQTNSAGVEPYIQPGVLAEKTFLTNATGAYGLAISEHMLGMLFEIIKKLHLYRDAQKKEEWDSMGSVTSIYGATVLVLGMGDIGGEFGKRCKALGAQVIGVRRKNAEKPDYADRVCLIDELDNILPCADVVAITLPGTEATRNMISRRRLENMKQGAVLLNVGRGYIVDTEALCDSLESGRLSGAGLDVTYPEPLPKGHRLWQIPSAVITPHISGYYHLKETHERIVGIFEENLKRYFAGEQLKNQVDFATGYRKL